MKWGLPERALKSANKRVTEVLSVEKSLKKRRKEQAGYSDKDRASIGGYAAENGNSRVLFTLNLTTLNLVKAPFVVLVQLFIYLIMNYKHHIMLHTCVQKDAN